MVKIADTSSGRSGRESAVGGSNPPVSRSRWFPDHTYIQSVVEDGRYFLQPSAAQSRSSAGSTNTAAAEAQPLGTRQLWVASRCTLRSLVPRLKLFCSEEEPRFAVYAMSQAHDVLLLMLEPDVEAKRQEQRLLSHLVQDCEFGWTLFRP